MALLRHLKRSKGRQVLDPERASEDNIRKDICSSDGQNVKKNVGIGKEDDEMRITGNSIECGIASTKTTGLEWEKKVLCMNMKLNDRQTRLESQMKALQDQLDSSRTRQSLNNWLDDQVHKI